MDPSTATCCHGFFNDQSDALRIASREDDLGASTSELDRGGSPDAASSSREHDDSHATHLTCARSPRPYIVGRCAMLRSADRPGLRAARAQPTIGRRHCSSGGRSRPWRGLSSHSNRPALAAATAPLSPMPWRTVAWLPSQSNRARCGNRTRKPGLRARRSSASRTTPSRWEQSRRRARSRGAVCPIRVVLERPVSSYSVAPFVAEQERAADDPPDTRDQPRAPGGLLLRRLEPEAAGASCSRFLAVPRRPEGKRPALSIRASSGCTDRTHRGRGCCRGRPYRAGLPQTWRGERSGPLGVVPQLVLSTFSIATLHVPAFVGMQ